MNRGVMVMRTDPDENELVDSARWVQLHKNYYSNSEFKNLFLYLYNYYRQICSGNDETTKHETSKLLRKYFQRLALGYLEICDQQKKQFFGLRDFYRYTRLLIDI